MSVKHVAISVEKVISATRRKRRASIFRDVAYFSASHATMKSLGGNLSSYLSPQIDVRALNLARTISGPSSSNISRQRRSCARLSSLFALRFACGPRMEGAAFERHGFAPEDG